MSLTPHRDKYFRVISLPAVLMVTGCVMSGQATGDFRNPRNYGELQDIVLGNKYEVTSKSDAYLYLRITRPRSTDIQIVLRITEGAASLEARESKECLECSLGIAEAKGQSKFLEELKRLAAQGSHRVSSSVDLDRAFDLLSSGIMAVETQTVGVRRAIESLNKTREVAIVLHAPFYEFEVQSGYQRVGAYFSGSDFDSGTCQVIYLGNRKGSRLGQIRSNRATTALRDLARL